MPNMTYLLTHADMMEDIDGEFYVIETFPYPQFVTDFDGNNKCFATYAEALEEANDCQEAFVISF